MRQLVQLIVQAGALVRYSLLTLCRSIRTQALRFPGPAPRIGRHRSVLLAVLLLLLVLTVHYLPNVLATQYPNPLAAERAWFYVAQGFKGLVLLAVILMLLPRRRRMVPVWAAAAWGAWEDGLVVSCRLAAGIGQPPPTTMGVWQGMCHQITQAPLHIVAAALAVIAATCIWHTLDDDDKAADD